MKRKTHKYRILVVDDEPNVLTTYKLILEQKGYQVIGAISSAEARAALDSQELHLLLCDLSLQEKHTGFDIIDYARQRQPNLPSVLLTGYATVEVSERAAQRSVTVLFKPIDISEFLGTISAHLRNAHEQVEASGE
jgi:DNA-binding NtrC family response regulator